MEIRKHITLDLLQPDMQVQVDAKQGDDASRYLEIELTEAGAPWQIPEGTAANFRCLKPDGRSCYNPAQITPEGTVLVELTEQCLAVPGAVAADVSLTGAGGEVLSSLNFVIRVERAPLGDLRDSRDELRVYEEQLEAVKEAISGIVVQDIQSFAVTEAADSVTVTVTGDDGAQSAVTAVFDAEGYPVSIDVDGRQIPVSWEVAT